MAADTVNDSFMSHFKCVFISVSTWPSFHSLFTVVYTTIKGEHIDLCGATVNC